MQINIAWHLVPFSILSIYGHKGLRACGKFTDNNSETSLYGEGQTARSSLNCDMAFWPWGWVIVLFLHGDI